MEKRRRIGECGSGGMEANTMAILDSSGFNNSEISHHLHDDRLAFLEAVRTASLLPENGSPPTRKMSEAIFHILKDADSLDLIIESYQLLVELDKRFPRVYLSKGEEVDSSLNPKVPSQLVMVEEAWSPFNFGLDSYSDKCEAKSHPKNSVDSASFHSLIQEIAEVVNNEMKSEAVETTFLKNMLLLQYLINVLEGDFWPRNCTYQEIADWTLLRDALLNMVLGSRKITYKGFAKDCVSLMCNMSQAVFSEETSCHEISLGERLHEINSAVALALPEAKKSTCIALKKLLLMIMELDLSRGTADEQGLTTRADGVRTAVVEIILDELIYNNEILLPFLQVFDPKWKLKIIVQCFQKYIPKCSVQTRRSNSTINTENFDGVLKCLSNSNSTRSIIKKISTEVIQLLLVYAFQAYLVLSYHVSEDLSDSMEDVKSNSMGEVCKNFVSVFTSLNQQDP